MRCIKTRSEYSMRPEQLILELIYQAWFNAMNDVHRKLSVIRTLGPVHIELELQTIFMDFLLKLKNVVSSF